MTEEKDQKISQTAKKVSDVLGDLSDSGEEASKFESFLKELDVSKKQFFTFLVIVLVFVVIIIYSFFAIFKVFKPESSDIDFRNDSNINEEVNDDPVEEPKVEEPKVDSKVLDNEEKASSKIIEQLNIRYDFLDLPINLSSRTSDEVGLDSMALLFSAAKNLHELDVFAFLDASEDRKRAFDEYVIKTEALLADVALNLSDLQREIKLLNDTISELESRLEVAENTFFETSDNLIIGKIDESLLLFQSINVKVSELRPLVKARQLFVNRFEDVLEIVPQKLEAVKANEDALVKAVKVQNINNFDLNLIK